MKQKNSEREKSEKDIYGIDEESSYYTCSNTDCTGLIPAGIVSEEELEAYQELYPDLYPDVSMKREVEEDDVKKKGTRNSKAK